MPQIISNEIGFFEFWVGDSSETKGYPTSQKFKITWERTGVESGMIDFIDVFPVTIPVNEYDTNKEKNKCVSNFLANLWTSHVENNTHIIHGIDEIDLALPIPIRNKLLSNTLGINWQNHRNYNFDPNVTTEDYSDEELLPWENPDNFITHGRCTWFTTNQLRRRYWQ